MHRAAVLFLGVLFLAGSAVDHARTAPSESLVSRFHTKTFRMPASYRALRHLEAANKSHNKSGWIDVVTEFAAGAMTYTVTARGGDEVVHRRVLLPALNAERDMVNDGGEPFGWNDANYRLEDAQAQDGRPLIRLIPKREDRWLVDGWLRLTPEGDVAQMSGRLSKSPSFWTKSVTMDQRYTTVRGTHLLVSVSSVAEVRIYGRSTFDMTYAYQMIDGRPVSVGVLDCKH